MPHRFITTLRQNKPDSGLATAWPGATSVQNIVTPDLIGGPWSEPSV